MSAVPGSPAAQAVVNKVIYFKVASEEARKFLSKVQYAHLVDIVKRLDRFGLPSGTEDLRIERVEDFYELKEKGGIFGRINVRVYFAFFPEKRRVCVLGAIKKEAEGQIPFHVLATMRNRLRNAKKQFG
jgi:hypothetical protein